MIIKYTHPLHLYRALLRETTYLFDDHARLWTQKYVKLSFRNCVVKAQDGTVWKTLPYQPDRVPSLTERHQLKRGRQFLTLLQHANQGYPRSLRTLLQLVYGRKGRQKRILTAPLLQDGLQVTSPNDGSEGNEQGLQITSTQPVAKFSKDWRAPKTFLSLLQAQNRLSDYLMIRSNIKLEPPVNEKNKWGKPMPPSRIKNTKKKWFARMARNVMPPVSEHEWARLKSIALGQQALKLIPRRAAAIRRIHDGKGEDTSVVANKMISGFEKEKSMKIHLSINNPHNLTPRFLSRFYARHILNHCPVVASDSKGDRVVSKWDNGVRVLIKTEKPKDQTQIDALFG